MKTKLFVFLFLFFAIPSIYGQSVANRAPLPTGETAIRSLVAQGSGLKMLLHFGTAGAYQVCIYSVSGQLVFQDAVQGQAGEAVKEISFSEHPHGIYVVNLNGANTHITREVIW